MSNLKILKVQKTNKNIWPVKLLIVWFMLFFGIFINTKNVSALESEVNQPNPIDTTISTKSEVIEQTEEKVSVNDVADSYKQLLDKLKNNENEKKEAVKEHKQEIARKKAEEERKRKEKKRSEVIEDALSKLGKRYVWGATGPNTFDCSGLTQWAYRQNGISIPRVAASQAQSGKRINKSSLEKGDLVFFKTDSSSPNRISHVGMYIGGGRFVHAPHTGDVVRISSLYASYWGNHYAWACRYVN